MRIKNVQTVLPISKYNNLADIYCMNEECSKTRMLREKFFIDSEGKIVAHFQHENAFAIEQLTPKYKNLFVIKEKDKNNNEGYRVVQFISDLTIPLTDFYEEIEWGVEDGCFAVKKNNLWGFINEEGIEIITPHYENYCAFSSGLAAVCKNDKWGFVNKKNETIIPFEYQRPAYSCFNNGYAPVGKNGKFGFINKTGEIVIPLKYEDTGCILENSTVFPVKLNGKWGLIDINENIVMPFEYDAIEIDPDNNPYYFIIKKDTCGLVGVNGQIIIPCKYNILCPNPNSICAGITFGDKQLYGLIDYNNKKITDFVYDKIYEYSSEGLYEARLNKKWGFIDESGNVAVDFQYYKVEYFCSGYAKVKDENYLEMIINHFGKVVLGPLPYRSIFNVGAGLFLVEKSGGTGYELIKL